MAEKERAFLLHTRPYTDSRILVELFTQHFGRISAVARIQKGRKQYSRLQAFSPLEVSWKGASGLKTLIQHESSGQQFYLQGRSLFCAMYINELVLRCLPQDAPHETTFDAYIEALEDLERAPKIGTEVEICLRKFEFCFLEDLGFALSLNIDHHGNAISDSEQVYYEFVHGEGFCFCEYLHDKRAYLFSGACLLALHEQKFDPPEVLASAKRLSRVALKPLLGERPLKARELFY